MDAREGEENEVAAAAEPTPRRPRRERGGSQKNRVVQERLKVLLWDEVVYLAKRLEAVASEGDPVSAFLEKIRSTWPSQRRLRGMSLEECRDFLPDFFDTMEKVVANFVEETESFPQGCADAKWTMDVCRAHAELLLGADFKAPELRPLFQEAESAVDLAQTPPVEPQI